MRPRLFTAENAVALMAQPFVRIASMRPRLFTAENGTHVVVVTVHGELQ